MRRIQTVLTLLLLSVLFFQCQREVSYIGGPDDPSQVATPDPITAAIQGNVFDETGAPAAGAAVQVGSKTATTNASGYFRINDAALDKKSGLVTAAKAGYFKAYRTFAATSGANFVQIKLIKRDVTGTVDAVTGGEVSLSNGSKVALSANGVVVASSNAAYTGQVKVYAAYIDPTAADFNQIVPGSLMADDKDGKRVMLTSYGMLAVELEGASGEKLQIKSGSTAKLTTAIPGGGQASAPASIPMWYVDENTGIWKEEGSAAKNGNVYVGDVKHFTYWNCDIRVPTVQFSATFKTQDGLPLTHAYVIIRQASANYSGSAHGYTDSLGQVSGPVPANMNLVMEVRSYGLGNCGNTLIHSQNIGPFSQNTDIGTVTVTNSNNLLVTVKGKLLNCSGSPVTNGYALIKLGYYSFYASVNGTGDFEKVITRCGTTPADFEILGVDNGALQQGTTPTVVPVASPTTNAGNVSACGISASQFINYTLDGTAFTLTAPGDSLTGFTEGQNTANSLFTLISGFSLAPAAKSISFTFQSPSAAPGTYALNRLKVNVNDTLSLVAPFNVNVTSFPTTVAGFYEGAFNGQFRDHNNALHTLSATFKVRRQR